MFFVAYLHDNSERVAGKLRMDKARLKNVEVRASPTDGLGVFALRSHRAGELVLSIDDSCVVDHTHPLTALDNPRHCDYLAGGKVVLMQYPERHINHSCDPNVYVATENGKRQVVAIRDIAAGEEISYDYSINSGGDTVRACSCGAERCRKKVHSDFFHLPANLQLEYLPLLDDWFRKERWAEVELLEALAREKALGGGES
jgi:hypothetical protein